MHCKSYLGFLLCCIFLLGTQGTRSQQIENRFKNVLDFEKAIQGKVYYDPLSIEWLEGQNVVVYSIRTPAGIKYYRVDAASGRKTEAFDFSRLSDSFFVANKKAGEEREKFIVRKFHFPDSVRVQFEAMGERWVTDLKTYRTIKVRDNRDEQGAFRSLSSGWRGSSDGSQPEVSSPDGEMIAFIKDQNVFIRDASDSSKVTQMSYDGTPADYYRRLLWSPDSKKIFAQKVKPGYERKITMVESSPMDQLQPKVHSINYLKPGDDLPQITPVIFLADANKQLIAQGTDLSNQYALSNFKWRKDSKSVVFEYNRRGHQQYQVIQMDASTGACQPVIDETVNTFFPYSPQYGKKFRYDVDDGKEIIWMSERDGWNHLYLYDGTAGRVKNQITKGQWVVRRVLHVDERNRKILFEGSGYNKDQDPYFIHVFSVQFDGKNLKQLTLGNGNHTTYFSPDHAYFIDTYSRVDTPSITVLRETKSGKVISTLERANVDALLATGWRYPEVFSAKGRDGQTDIWGIIIRPSHFDPSKTYPVIEGIYAGPHDSFVPKSFSADPNGRLVGMAELGFIVVQIDGMGTSNRSKKFHDVCYKNLKDAGFPDRIPWMKAAAKKYPYMDLTRVGIYGRSAGGQESSAGVLFHPDFYKVAVSTAGCYDNRMDKMWWNEQWMGYPIGPQYVESSDTENAWRLKGNLMLIVGELDTNVDPASTYQFANELIKHGKDFELVMLPGQNHKSTGVYADYEEMKRRSFFVQHLLNK